jgi:hypothetical protein
MGIKVSKLWRGENLTKYLRTRESLGFVLRELEIIAPIISKRPGGRSFSNKEIENMMIWKQIYLDLDIPDVILNPMIFRYCNTTEDVKNLFNERLKIVDNSVSILSQSENGTPRGDILNTMTIRIQGYFEDQGLLLDEFVASMLEYNIKSYNWQIIKHQE